MYKNDRKGMINIFRDTCVWCGKEPLKEAIESSALRQRVYKETDTVIHAGYLHDEKAQVIVLNFASACMPGGGVKYGSSAQEESICRCSTLYSCLDRPEIFKDFYLEHRNSQNPLHNNDLVYTPDVVVFKTDTSHPIRMEQNDWYSVNVISCAAPNCRNVPSNLYNPYEGTEPAAIGYRELINIHESRARRILDVAAAEGNQVVVLGAFGCGAFQNLPDAVAVAYWKTIPDYLNSFDVIEFAIPNKPDETNYRAFSKHLRTFSK